jgi:hypothetical protein
MYMAEFFFLYIYFCHDFRKINGRIKFSRNVHLALYRGGPAAERQDGRSLPPAGSFFYFLVFHF